MFKMVDGTGIIGVDMICPLGVSTPQPPNYDRVEMEGAGILVLPNSLDAPLERLELGGKTEQVTTTGAQLFDKNSVVNGVIIADGTVTDNAPLYATSDYIPVKPSVTYACTETGSKRLKFFDADKQPVQNINFEDANVERGGTLTTGETTSFIRLSLLREKLDSITLNEGSKSIPYEPYTGGKPSPSSEYPQEIKSVGKWNDGTQKYEVSVKVTGRNLFNGKLSKGKFITDDMNVVSDLVTMNTFDKPVEIEPNTDYVISANGVIWEGNINVYDENGKKIVQHFTGKFKTPSNAKYIRASISNARAPIDSKIQMEYGTAMNEFEQYHQPQSLTLTSDRPITKWDKLVEQDGQIGWLYQSNTVVIDGSETWSSSNVPDHIYFTTTVNNKSGRINTSLCKTYKNNGEPVFNKKHEGEYNIYSDHPTNGVSDTAFVPPNETVTTIPQWKEWLNANPIEMLYKTKTTEFIPFPQSEQNAIRALKTYYPTTVITADGGELDPDIKATYRKEI